MIIFFLVFNYVFAHVYGSLIVLLQHVIVFKNLKNYFPVIQNLLKAYCHRAVTYLMAK